MFFLYHLIRLTTDEDVGVHGDEQISPLHGLPAPLLVLLALACLLLAACVAGLTLGLMSLDTTGLDIVMQSNNLRQAAAARAIKPIREQGNLLLVTLLFANTIATELLPLVLEALVPGGIFSLVVSVASIMLFGEIIPQAICSRHPLLIGSYMIGFVKFLRTVLYPVAYPIAWVLDVFLGEELGTIYNREELKGLIDVHASNAVLTKDETTILKGALEFSVKTVAQILTPAENVFLLDIDSRLDRTTMLRILRSGHSRVPLYEDNPHNIVCLLLVKQIILVNPDDNLPIRSLISKKQRNHKIRVAPALECSENTLIPDLLNEFQVGRSHMAIVYNDIHLPHEEREFVGIVSIEDIIEEILQEEIVDETDTYVDNTNKTRVLIRNAEGKLVRSTTTSTRSKVLPGRSGSAVVLKEIDVKALRTPLERNGEKYCRDWKQPKSRGESSRSFIPSDDAATDIEKGIHSPRTPSVGAGPSTSQARLSDISPLVLSTSIGTAGADIQYATLPSQSSRSLFGEDDELVPEDLVKTASGDVDGDGTSVTVEVVPSKPVKVRPLPKDASDERAVQIPLRLRPSQSRSTTPSNPALRSYGSIRPTEDLGEGA